MDLAARSSRLAAGCPKSTKKPDGTQPRSIAKARHASESNPPLRRTMVVGSSLSMGLLSGGGCLPDHSGGRARIPDFARDGDKAALLGGSRPRMLLRKPERPRAPFHRVHKEHRKAQADAHFAGLEATPPRPRRFDRGRRPLPPASDGSRTGCRRAGTSSTTCPSGTAGRTSITSSSARRESSR